jgi:hypothetical protein
MAAAGLARCAPRAAGRPPISREWARTYALGPDFVSGTAREAGPAPASVPRGEGPGRVEGEDSRAVRLGFPAAASGFLFGQNNLRRSPPVRFGKSLLGGTGANGFGNHPRITARLAGGFVRGCARGVRPVPCSRIDAVDVSEEFPGGPDNVFVVRVAQRQEASGRASRQPPAPPLAASPPGRRRRCPGHPGPIQRPVQLRAPCAGSRFEFTSPTAPRSRNVRRDTA